MQIILDTNILVRFFTNDIPDKAKDVKKLFETGENLLIPDVVFPELEYVLCRQYAISRAELLEKFEFLSAQGYITISNEVKTALALYASSHLDMADCIIASHSLKGKLASFDKELLNIDGIKPFWK